MPGKAVKELDRGDSPGEGNEIFKYNRLIIKKMNIYSNITELIGETPCVELLRLNSGGARVIAKLEMFNPLSSVKDRIALNMIEAAERDDILKKGSTVVEPTSGNTGIGLACVCAVRGYKLVLTMPETMSMERRILLKALGAELVLTEGSRGIKGALAEAEKIVAERGAVMLQQFQNPANPDAHRGTTAEEIWKDTDGEVDIFVAGVGTGGTITGVGETLKKKKSSVRVTAVEPAGSPVLSGGEAGPHRIQGIGAGFIPGVLNREIIDEVIAIDDERAGQCARDLARLEGIPAGISAGASVAAALELSSRKENRGKMIVALLPDSGERYLSTWLYRE